MQPRGKTNLNDIIEYDRLLGKFRSVEEEVEEVLAAYEQRIIERSRILTPYRVHCLGLCITTVAEAKSGIEARTQPCPPSCLTQEEYDGEMLAAGSKWRCPVCGAEAKWDDTWHETFNEDDQTQ